MFQHYCSISCVLHLYSRNIYLDIFTHLTPHMHHARPPPSVWWKMKTGYNAGGAYVLWPVQGDAVPVGL